MQTATSKDGTKIAYDKLGQGQSVIIVDGATGSRAAGYSRKLAELLAKNFTVYYYDRRGRGDSTDTQPFTVGREIEDIEALIDDAGGTAFLVGFSSGACLAFEAALALDSKVDKLALFEPPYNDDKASIPEWHAYTKKINELDKAGKYGEMFVEFMNLVGVPQEMIDNMKKSPMWPGLESVAHTLLYDAAEIGVDRAVPVERAKKLVVPTLLLDGEKNLQIMPFMHVTADTLAQAIPNAKRITLAGQGHDVAAEAIGPKLVEFFTN